MPAGMKLKSEGFASSLYDPQSKFTLAKYCADRGLPYSDIGLPVPVETFVDYGIAFQQECVPELQKCLATSVEKKNGAFTIGCEDGSKHSARQVIVATGIAYISYTPEILSRLGPQYVSHSSDNASFRQFSGRDVAIVGAGSSAVDVAAALLAAGARVQVIARTPEIRFHNRHARVPRPFMDRLRAPMTGLGPGWRSLLCTELPLVFHKLPSDFRLKIVRKHLGPAAGWFVKDQVAGKVPFHVESAVTGATVDAGRVRLKVQNPRGSQWLDFDHVIAGTGFRPDVSKLPFMHAGLRAKVRSVNGFPALSTNFESSVPGLYFVGPSSAGSFGPLMRFAYGAKYTARRLSRHLAT